jgi:photosystem II stability/assembly factor-like uncharacterized protein
LSSPRPMEASAGRHRLSRRESPCSRATTTHCWALGLGTSGNVIVATTNGGKSWKAQSLNGIFLLADLSCPTTSTCVAVGLASPFLGFAVSTTNGGQDWVVDSLPEETGPLTGVSCSTAEHCWAVGTTSAGAGEADVVATTNAGNTWVTQQLPGGLADVDDIWCAASGSCRAVGLASNGGVAILANISVMPLTRPPAR